MTATGGSSTPTPGSGVEPAQSDSEEKSADHRKPGYVLILFTATVMLLNGATAYGRGANIAEGLGRASFSLLFPLLIVGLFQLGRRFRNPRSRTNIYLGTSVVLLILFFVSLASQGQQVVTEAERQLQVSAGYIHSPEFGFSLPHPGEEFALLPQPPIEMSEKLASQPGVFAWVLEHSDSPETVVVLISKFGVSNERDFRRFANGLKEGSSDLAVTVLEDTFIWESTDREFRFRVKLDNGLYVSFRCLASDVGRGKSFYVCVSTVSEEAAGLEFVRTDLAAP